MEQIPYMMVAFLMVVILDIVISMIPFPSEREGDE